MAGLRAAAHDTRTREAGAQQIAEEALCLEVERAHLFKAIPTHVIGSREAQSAQLQLKDARPINE